MATLAKLNVLLTADSSNLVKGVENARRKVGTFGKDLARVGKGMSAAITLPMALAAAGAIKLASDAEEAGNKFDVVMGRGAAKAREKLQELTNTIPITRAEMEGMAGGIQDMLVPMGLAREKAAGMSVDMVALAGDLGSFNNVGTTEVLEAMQSALAGSSEPMRRFGVDTRVTRLETLAQKEGIIKLGEKLNNTTTALAVMAAIQADSTDAMGDAERTVDSTANSFKFLTRDIKQMGITIGQILIPAVTPIVKRFSEWIARFQNLSPKMQSFIVKIGLAAAAIGPLLIVMGTLIAVAATLAGAIGPVTIAIGLAIAAIIKMDTKGRKKMVEALKKMAAGLLAFLTPLGNLVAATAIAVAELVRLWWEGMRLLAPLATWFWDNVAKPWLKGLQILMWEISNILNKVGGFFGRARIEIADITGDLAFTVDDKWRGMVDAMREMTSGAFASIESMFQQLNTNLTATVTKIKDDIIFEMVDLGELMPVVLSTAGIRADAAVRNMGETLKQTTRRIVGDMSDIWGEIDSVLAGVGLDNTFTNSLAKWARFADGVIGILDRITKFVSEQGGGFFGFLGDVVSGISRLFGGGGPPQTPQGNNNMWTPPVYDTNPNNNLVAPAGAGGLSLTVQTNFNGDVGDPSAVTAAVESGIVAGVSRALGRDVRVQEGHTGSARI